MGLVQGFNAKDKSLRVRVILWMERPQKDIRLYQRWSISRNVQPIYFDNAFQLVKKPGSNGSWEITKEECEELLGLILGSTFPPTSPIVFWEEFDAFQKRSLTQYILEATSLELHEPTTRFFHPRKHTLLINSTTTACPKRNISEVIMDLTEIVHSSCPLVPYRWKLGTAYLDHSGRRMWLHVKLDGMEDNLISEDITLYSRGSIEHCTFLRTELTPFRVSETVWMSLEYQGRSLDLSDFYYGPPEEDTNIQQLHQADPIKQHHKNTQ